MRYRKGVINLLIYGIEWHLIRDHNALCKRYANGW